VQFSAICESRSLVLVIKPHVWNSTDNYSNKKHKNSTLVPSY